MPERISKPNGIVVFTDLGLIEYKLALEIQMECLAQKTASPDVPDTIFLLEHPPVFTLGKNGGAENLMVSEDFLAARSIEVIQTQRGGNITGHSPGQLVMYPIIDLEKNRLGVKDFVHGLEQMMILTANTLGVDAARSSKNPGIWVDNNKIGSIGLGVKKGISFHGISFNLKPDMEFFSWINPCGLNGVSMTSIQNELDKNGSSNGHALLPSIETTKNLLKEHFCEVFNFRQIA